MLEVRKDAKDINQKLEDLGEDTENWMDDLDYQVDSIKAKMEEYIESRQADPPSEPGGSWLLGRFLQTDIEEDASKLQMRMNAVSIGQEHAPVVSSNSSTTIAPTPTVYTSAATTFSAGFNKPINTNTFRQRVDPTPFQLMNATKTKDFVAKESNQVDSWIDQLDVAKPPHDPTVGKLDNSLATWFVQQGLPRIRIPWFDGTPSNYVDFITSFRDLVHNQDYLSTLQRCVYLHQAVRGEVKRSIQGFRNDFEGYVMALKRIKYMFGQRSRIAESVIGKVVNYRPINNRDQDSLTEFYYTLSDCLVTLRKLNYVSDLYSTDILRQACTKLPQYLLHKWADYCLLLRRNCEPNLTHLEGWLQERILASKDSYLPRKGDDRKDQRDQKDQRRSNQQQNGQLFTGKIGNAKSKLKDSNRPYNTCYICNDKHRIHKCPQYISLDPPERFEMAKKNKLCYNCLKKDHFTSKCQSKNNCFNAGCTERHHTTLHEYFTEQAVKQFTGSTQTVEPDGTVFLSVVPVRLKGLDSSSIITYALLDTGSQSTLIRSDIANKLKLKKKDRKITITTINDTGSKTRVKETSLRVENKDDGVGVDIEHCYIVPKTSFYMPKQQYSSTMMEKMKNEQGIKLHNALSEEIGLLIGANAPSVHIPIEIVEGKEAQPFAIRTMFGWTLFGACGQPKTISMNNLIIKSDENLHQSVKRLWDQDFMTNPSDRDEAPSIEDQRCYEKMESETTFNNGKYEVPMLWKKEITLPNNRSVAEKRFNQLQARLRREPTLRELYEGSMVKYLESGYARKMSPDEAAKEHSRTWYLPHYGVFNPNKPGKIRIVFDAAAKFQGTSLNDALHTGPDLLNNMLGVLMRFRTYPVAFSADIEGMFNQVRVTQEDRQSLRFLWKENIDSKNPPDTYQMVVHIMGATCSPTCANYALKRCARDRQDQFSPTTVETVLRSFYVDDLLKSVQDVQTGQPLVKELIELTKAGGNKLTKFVSNSPELLADLPKDLLSPTSNVQMEGQNPSTKALGVTWNTKEDVLTFKPCIAVNTSTKRAILSVVSSLYDPLGFLAPYTTTAKMILQDVWKSGTSWDEPIKPEIEKKWQKWLVGLSTINSFKLERCYNLPISSKLQLHIFGDASEGAYGAVAYLRTSTEPINVSFVTAKGRVAPTKQVPLPRLELSAATIAVRLYRLIIKEIDLPIEDSHFWSDSTLTLQYITNEKNRFKTFVANRVTEIREVTESSQWHHIDGDKNPGDITTRGVFDAKDLLKGDDKRSWLKGPTFLSKDDFTWKNQTTHELDSGDPEIKRMFVASIRKNADTLMNYTDYAKLDKIFRIMAWMRRFANNCQKKKKKLVNFLKPDEIKTASILIIKDVQQSEFDEEIEDLQNKREIEKESKLHQFKPFLDDDGIMRVGGRLKSAPISFDAKHQIFIPKGHFATLIAEKYHRRNGHVGVNQTLSEIRQKYWILNGRIVTKRVIKSCIECQRFRTKPEIPMMADLPASRTQLEEPPFTNTGVDFFGPLTIKQGRKHLKRWVSLFTCMTIRCVHLEVVESLETDDFLNALQRFISRRQKPKKMLSDCGTNFKGAANELKEELKKLNHNKIGDFCTNKEMEWQFNPPSAPHMGGAWERLVRTVKTTMKFVLKNLILTEFQLITFITEVENIVNSRPLTPLSEDPNDMEPLTPNHFLKGFNNSDVLLETNQVSNKGKIFRKKWKHIQMCLDHFWTRWKLEYLPTLTTRGKWVEERKNLTNGELVLLQTDAPRGQWPLGVISETVPGRDGRIRMAYVRTKSGTYLRPAAKIYRLELPSR